MAIRKQLYSLAIFIFVLCLSGASWADTHARIVRLSLIEGDDVQMDRGDGRGFDRAFLNMPVVHGSRIWTRNNSLAEIEFEDGSTIRMTPGALITFRDLTLLDNGQRQTVVDVSEGTVYFNVLKHDASGFRVTYDRQEVSPTRATAHFRLLVDKNESVLAVFNGKVRVSNATTSQVEVGKGESIRLEPTDYGRYFLAKGVDDDHYDAWDRGREQDREAYSARPVYAGNQGYYGQSDLTRYGSYFSDPSYGTLWRPYYLGASWDPFADGSWVNYPGYGYTWVSPYAWGWTPYRYGSWVFVPVYGWCWQPGGYNQFTGLPVVINPPYHHIRPVPPSPGVGAPVVIVGRGPQGVLPGAPLTGPAARTADSADIGDRSMAGGKHRRDNPAGGANMGGAAAPASGYTAYPAAQQPAARTNYPGTTSGLSSGLPGSPVSREPINDPRNDTRDRAIVPANRGYQPVPSQNDRGRDRAADDVQERSVMPSKSAAPSTYSPPAHSYSPPPAQTYNPPARTYTPPPQQTYTPPARTNSPPPQTYSPPPAQSAPRAPKQSEK